MEIKKCQLSLLTWSPYYAEKKNFIDIFKQSAINVQTNLYKNWKLSDNQIITPIHPPLRTIKLIMLKIKF